MPLKNGLPINGDNDDDLYEALMERQNKGDKNCETLKDPVSTLVGPK